MDNFNIEKEFEILKNNGWLEEDEIENYIKNNDLINAVRKSTSPKKENIFNSLKLVSCDSLRVVILGQDPYPNPSHAHGLAFSSKDGTTPDSLKNIFRAIDSVYNTSLFENKFNDLTSWANQGVLLLNTGLTYEKNDSNLPKKEKDKLQQKIQKENLKIWRPFINNIIKKILNIKTRPIVMMLWGNSAHELVFKNIQNKDFKDSLHKRTPEIIPETLIMLLQTSHPSPLSVNRGGDFLETASEHFRECEKHLGANKIDWKLL